MNSVVQSRTTHRTPRLITGVAWHIEVLEPTPIDEDGFPTCPAPEVLGTITFLDDDLRPVRSVTVTNVPKALRELRRSPVRLLRSTRRDDRIAVDAKALAICAATAEEQVDRCLLANSCIPRTWV